MTRTWSDPEVDALFGPWDDPEQPDCEPQWPPDRDTRDLPDIGNYQEER